MPSLKRARPGLLVALLACASLLAVSAPAGATPAPNKTNKIVYVHGFSPTGSTDCSSSGYANDGFGKMIPQMQSAGFTGSQITVGYYSGDSNCTINLHNYGSYGDGDTFKEIGKAFSWYVYNTFTRNGISIDAVGYSMGGLIVRAAIYGASIGASGFSPPINIAQAVTLAAPHDGAAWYASACTIVGWTQCDAMVGGSSQLNWLNQNGNPQGSAGTTWTNFGSTDDDVVPDSSATSMSLSTSRKIVFENVSHTGWIHPNYMDAWSVVNLAGAALGVSPTRIVSGIDSAKCVDDKGASTSNGTPIQIYDCNGGAAQSFIHMNTGSRVLSVMGRCMDDTGSGTSNGTKIELYRCNNTGAQTWTPGASGSLQDFSKCLDDPSSNITNGTQLQLYTCNGTNAQRWVFG